MREGAGSGPLARCCVAPPIRLDVTSGRDVPWTYNAANGSYNGKVSMRITNIPLRLPTFISVFVSIFAAQAQDKSCCEMKIAATPDAPARLTVTITNVNSPTVGVLRTSPYRDFGMTVKTDAGGEVDRTELGKRLLRQPWEFRRTYEELKAGESVNEELDLSTIFEMKSGTYKVTLTHEVYAGGVKSGTKVSLKSTTDIRIP